MNSDLVKKMIEVQEALSEQEFKSQRLLIGILSACALLLFIGLATLFLVFRRKNRLSIQNVKLIILRQHIEPLMGVNDNMLAITYVLLTIDMGVQEIAKLLHKDRTTIHHWIADIKNILDVEDVRKDALRHSTTFTQQDELVRFLGLDQNT